MTTTFRADEGLAFLLQYENVAWYDAGEVRILDRRVYPAKTEFVTCRTHGEVAQAIRDMVTQSAGPYTAAAMGMALAAYECREKPADEQLTQPVRLLKLLGVRALIVTNAAGGVNERYRPGDFMLIADQIKLNGASPLRGRNADEFGPRFFDVTRMYTPELRALAKTCADELGIRVQEGVYFFMPGPQFETPAEIRAIRALGGDAVGMSTVTEALTAAHCGLPLLGISVITNMAAGITGEAVSGEEVNETGAAVAERFSRYLETILEEMDV